MFSSSSRAPGGRNRDGSINNYCASCREFIARSIEPMGRVLCTQCSDDPQLMDSRTAAAYRLSKGQDAKVSFLHLPEPENRLVGADQFSFRSMGGRLLRSLGIPLPAPEETPRSVKLSNSRERGRLLEHADLDDMESLDTMLKKKE